MSQLKINRGSIIHLRFNYQPNTIVDGNVPSYSIHPFESSSRPERLTDVNRDKFTDVEYQYAVECDNPTIQLMLSSSAITKITSIQGLQDKPSVSSVASGIKNETISGFLQSSSNWIGSSEKLNESSKQLAIVSSEKKIMDHLNITLQIRLYPLLIANQLTQLKPVLVR